MARRIFQVFSFTALRNDERGASMVEYALLASLIAVAAVGSVTNLGQQNKDTFNRVQQELRDVNACAGINNAQCNVAPPVR